SALVKSIDSRQRAAVDAQYSQMIMQRNRQEQVQNRLARKEREDTFNDLYEQSKSLLSYDRMALNKKMGNLQTAMEDSLEQFGGNVSRFMEAGGYEQLANYKRDILNSDEMIRYQQNAN